jgi:hypothetical protein
LKNPQAAILARQDGIEVIVLADVINKQAVDSISTHVKGYVFPTVVDIKNMVTSRPNSSVLNSDTSDSLSDGRGHVEELFSFLGYANNRLVMRCKYLISLL